MADIQKKVLVAVDGSERAHKVVKYVAESGLFNDMKVVIFNVFSSIPKYYQDLEKDPRFHNASLEVRAWEAGQRSLIRDFMNKSQSLLIKAGFPPENVVVNIHDRQIGIARDIIKESKEGYNCILAGRKGMSKIREIAMGSTALKIIEKINFMPVLTVGNRIPNDKFLVAVDGSDGANCALTFLGNTLASKESPITLFHVIRKSDEIQADFQKYFLPDSSFIVAEQETTAILSQAVDRLVNLGVKRDRISTKFVLSTSRAAAIVKEADQSDIGTIVLGRRGLSAVQEFFIGRVSNKVFQMARSNTVWIVSAG